MAEKNLYKTIALIVAIFIYLIFAFSLAYYVKEEAKMKKDYGFNVEDAIVVNIDSLIKEEPKPVEKQKPVPVQMPKPEIKPAPKEKPKAKTPVLEVVEKESRDKEAKTAKDLFSTVRTDEYKKAMSERQKREEARASRLKKQKAEEAIRKAEQKRKKEQYDKAQEAQKLVQQMQISKPSKSEKSGDKHEYWSFVSSKIMAKWERTIATESGLSATVNIRIDNKGKLTYRDLKSSYNSLFDTKLKVFLDNLEYDRFPSYKHGSHIEAEFEFTDKEKGI